MNRYRHATLVLSLVALLTFTPPVHGAYASNGAFTNFWCNITSFFGFTCDTPNEIVITEPEVSVAPPSPLPQSADYQMVNAVNETPAPNTTIVEEHNTYTTNPTTVVYQTTNVNDDKISDTQFLNLFQKLTTIINQTSQQNPAISRDLFAKQVDKIYEKSNDSTDNVQDNLDTLQANNSASFATELLTVTGNTSIDGNTTVGGDLNVIGTITAGVLNVDALSSGGALVAPYFTATSTTATSSFMGAVGIGTTTPSSKLDVAGNINISAGSAYSYNSANVITASTTLNNYFFGGAGNLTMTGTGNTGSGYQALLSNTTGLYNTANGWQALYSNTTGYSNSANGKQTLYSNATGHSNIANGVEALYSNTTGNLNIASGVSSLLSNTTGSYNVAIGTSALRLNTTGSSNTALGNSAGRYTTDGVTGNATGSNSVFLGADTKALNGNDTNQIVIGYNATGNGSNSVTLGNTSITKTVLQGNVGIGTTTPTSKLTVVGDVNIQGTATSSAVITLRDPIGNISLEMRAGTSTLLNTFVGVGAGSSNTTGTYNVANGYYSLYSNTTGTENTAVGHNSLNFNTTGSYNTAVGRNAIYANTTGNNNTANGVNALYSNTTGSENTANGVYALLSNTTGTFNNANGYMSMRFNTTGSENTANGVASLYSNITGSYNTAIGRSAGRYLTDGTSAASTTDYSLFLGYNTKALTDNDQNAIVIGYNANGIGSNTVVLGNDSIVTTALKGNVGIGTTSPTEKLMVAGNLSLNGLVLQGSTAVNDNFVVNSTDNAIENGLIVSTILGGRDGWSNLIGSTGKPNGADFTPADWSNDTGYVAGSASISTISGGYDNIVNQLAGVIGGGGHNFLKYNSDGHSIIGGGSYNLISAGRSGIFSGRRNTVTGAEVFSFIGGGDDNNIVGSYSVIPGGYMNDISGDYSFAFGRRAQVTADGAVAFADSTDSDFTASVANQFAARYSGGYRLTDGRFQVMDDLATDGALAQFYDTTSDTGLDIRSNTGGSGLASKHIDLVGLSSASDLAFSPSSDTRRALVIKDGGNIGIGTTTPNSKLTVFGDVNISDSSQGYKLDNNRILYASTTNFSTLVGNGAGQALLGDGLYSTALGYQALYSATSSDNNTAVGYRALYANTTGSSNIALGFQALRFNTTGNENTAIGRDALYSNTTGSYNTATGRGALLSNTTGLYNTANGYDSLFANSTGINNLANGYRSLYTNTTGSENFAAGNNALYFNTIGSNNVAIGHSAIYSNTTGSYNIALGRNAGYDINTATSTGANTILGYNTGRGIVTGVNNTILGANVTGLSSTLSNNIIIADGAGNQRINVDSSGNVGIGSTTPSHILSLYRSTGSLISVNSDTKSDIYLDTYSNVTGNNGEVLLRRARGTSSSPVIVQDGDSLGRIGSMGYGSSGFVHVARLRFAVDGTPGSTIPGRIVFETTNGVGTTAERARLTAEGNFGIGSTTPSSKLTVTQSADSATGGVWLSTSNNTDFRSQYMNTSGVLSFYGGDTAGTLNTATLNAAGEWTNASDISYKENIEKLSYGLDVVLALQPRSYDIKNTNNHRIGFIAQEVEEVIPEVVSGEDGSKGISYGNLVAVAISAIQELAGKVNGFASLFKSERIETNTLCVGNTCVTETELQELLQDKLEQSKSGNKSESSTNTDTSSSESPVEIEPVATSTDNLSVELEGSVSKDLTVDDLEVEIVEDLPVEEVVEENSVTNLEN